MSDNPNIKSEWALGLEALGSPAMQVNPQLLKKMIQAGAAEAKQHAAQPLSNTGQTVQSPANLKKNTG